MRHLLLAAIAAAALSITGCAAAHPASTSTAGTDATPSPTVETTPATNTADPATWIIAPTGIGPFQLGADLKAVEAGLPSLAPDPTVDCPNPGVEFLASPVVNVTVEKDAAGKVVGVEVGNQFQIPSSPIGLAHTPLAGPHTAEGVGLGSTLDELKAGSPSAAQSGYDGFNPDFPSWTVQSSASSWTTFLLRADTQTVNAIGVWPGTLPPSEYCG